MSAGRAASSRRNDLARIRRMCLALPDAVERPFGDHTSPAFRVRDKFFVMTSEDGSSMTLKAPKGVQAVLVASDPGRFFVPKYVGHIGWVGVRLDLDEPPDWDELAEMIAESYCLTAPKRLAAQVDPGEGRPPVSGRAPAR
ncbi:MAG TPA: MmcQ/YjbR family DNA-binding protein [Acidimicrobiales bacterium]|nr:MmcQ/YjbR family DNA-binding protein [Acidimicrobiales bacterium]